VAIHGDKEQCEREASIDAFKRGDKDVLVATDVASKVLDVTWRGVITFTSPGPCEWVWM
jgi:ATP-dependent RNA helicase DDX41